MVRPDIFLTPTEKETFSEWTSRDQDNSITTLALTPIWNQIVRLFVPESVAPNILSFGGLLCLVHAWYLCFLYMDTQPRLISAAAIFLIIAYHTLDGIDGKHAKLTHNDTPLGEFFAHCCSNVGFVFSTLTACYVLGITDLSTKWYLVEIGQLVALRCHISAFKTKVVSFSTFTGPGEGLFVILVLMGTKAAFPSIFNSIPGIISSIVIWLNNKNMIYHLDPYDYVSILASFTHVFYYALVGLTLCDVVFKIPTMNHATRNGLVFCIFYRSGPAVLMWLGVMPGSFTVLDLICEGLFMSTLTSDIILAKMANRDLHPYIVIFAMLSFR